MSDSPKPDMALEALAYDQVQLLLSEKRTALSALRTGIAIFAFPLSALSVLIATSKSYEIHQVLPWLVSLILLNVGLILLGVYLITRSVRHLRHYDRMIAEIKHKHSKLAELLD